MSDLYAAIAKELEIEVDEILNVGFLPGGTDTYSVLIANNDERKTARRATVDASKVAKPSVVKKAKAAADAS